VPGRRAAGDLRPARRLVAALGRAFQGAGHQRCRVHFARNLLALVQSRTVLPFGSSVHHGRQNMGIVTTIGVDAHSRIHVAAAVDPQGRLLAEHAITAGSRNFRSS
jgi:hypothetical protein